MDLENWIQKIGFRGKDGYIKVDLENKWIKKMLELGKSWIQ